jgi:transcriptional regulator with XRE-family HTH domain
LIIEKGAEMLQNNVEMDLKMRLIESGQTQKEVAGKLGVSLSYVNRITKSREQIVNRTFIAMMEQLGYDVELTYVKRGEC